MGIEETVGKSETEDENRNAEEVKEMIIEEDYSWLELDEFDDNN